MLTWEILIENLVLLKLFIFPHLPLNVQHNKAACPSQRFRNHFHGEGAEPRKQENSRNCTKDAAISDLFPVVITFEFQVLAGRIFVSLH
jgi:hypothetical protein